MPAVFIPSVNGNGNGPNGNGVDEVDNMKLMFSLQLIVANLANPSPVSMICNICSILPPYYHHRH